MNYEEFKAEMERLLTRAFKYEPGQIGFGEGAAAMADLADAHPEFDARWEAESAPQKK